MSTKDHPKTEWSCHLCDRLIPEPDDDDYSSNFCSEDCERMWKQAPISVEDSDGPTKEFDKYEGDDERYDRARDERDEEVRDDN